MHLEEALLDYVLDYQGLSGRATLFLLLLMDLKIGYFIHCYKNDIASLFFRKLYNCMGYTGPLFHIEMKILNYFLKTLYANWCKIVISYHLSPANGCTN